MREPPLTRKDFQVLAKLRDKEAGTLSKYGDEQGAYYLAGYAVECALKACIAKKSKRWEFPPKRKYVDQVYTHDLNLLLQAAELDKQLDLDMESNLKLAANWTAVTDWNENSRYVISSLNGKDLYLAITGRNGVLPWIKHHW